MGKVINIQTAGNLGIQAKVDDAISGFVLHVPAPSGGATYQLDGVYKLNSVVDLEALGIDEAFDTANSVNAFQTINEFFTVNPTGTAYIMTVQTTVLLSAILTHTSPTSAIKLVNFAQGKIKQLGICYCPAVTVDVVWTTVFTAAIPLAQAFAVYCRDNARPLHIVLEGYGLNNSVNFKALNSNKVSVMLGQNDYFYSKGAFAQPHKAIGVALGIISLAPVNDNIGWVGKYNLLQGTLTTGRLNGVLIDSIPEDTFDDLDELGGLYFRYYTDYPGIYMNDSFTCTLATDDYSKIEKNRTWNKAARLIRTAMLPYVNSTVFIDSNTGKLESITVSVMEASGNKALQVMFQNGEISGPDPLGATPPFQIDADQDVIATNELVTQLSIVPTGVAGVITNKIGFKNPNN